MQHGTVSSIKAFTRKPWHISRVIWRTMYIVYGQPLYIITVLKYRYIIIFWDTEYWDKRLLSSTGNQFDTMITVINTSPRATQILYTTFYNQQVSKWINAFSKAPFIPGLWDIQFSASNKRRYILLGYIEISRIPFHY